MRYPASGFVRASLFAVMIAAFIASGAAAATAAEKLKVEAKKTDSGVVVHASARLRAPYAVIWNTLTDFDSFAEFIPGMEKSHVLSRNGTSAVVEQSGNAGNMLLRYPINIIVATEEQPPTTISVKILSGNLRTYEGAYHLERVTDGTDDYIISWSGTIQPDIELPAFIEEWALRQSVRTEFVGMLGEIERRSKNGPLG